MKKNSEMWIWPDKYPSNTYQVNIKSNIYPTNEVHSTHSYFLDTLYRMCPHDVILQSYRSITSLCLTSTVIHAPFTDITGISSIQWTIKGEIELSYKAVNFGEDVLGKISK